MSELPNKGDKVYCVNCAGRLDTYVFRCEVDNGLWLVAEKEDSPECEEYYLLATTLERTEQKAWDAYRSSLTGRLSGLCQTVADAIDDLYRTETELARVEKLLVETASTYKEPIDE